MARRPGTPVEYLQTDIPDTDISFDAEAFDNFIRSQGVRLIHYRAMRCPVGMTDIGDNRRPHEDHQGCSNGFLYAKAGCIVASLIGNNNKKDLRDLGFVDGASFSSTFPRCYDNPDNKPFYMAPFDRFYLDEDSITVPTWQLIKASEYGTERLNFPAVEVESFVDNRGEIYEQCADFELNASGQIYWLPTGRRPMVDLETGNQAVCSVRYRYRPFWYVARMMHEIRVAATDNMMTGERGITRMPQQAMLNREFLFLNEANDDMAIDPRQATHTSSSPGAPRGQSLRQTPGPDQDDGGDAQGGQFGPR